MSIMAVGRAAANEIGGMGVGSMQPSLQHVVSAPPFSSSIRCWPERLNRKRHAQEIVFHVVCRLEAILDDLNCRKVARNQGIGMCRNSKRSDQSVGEKEGGLASSMLKARSQDRQTSWFDQCDSCRAAVRLAPSRRTGVPSACSDAAVHGRALEWASWQFKETRPSQRPTRHCLRTSGNVRPCIFILFPTALAVAVGGNQRHENGSGRVAAENFISPARFP